MQETEIRNYTTPQLIDVNKKCSIIIVIKWYIYGMTMST